MIPAALKLALDPAEILRAQKLNPDPWQCEFLLCEDRRVMLCCSRGAGKTRATSAKALHKAYFTPGSLILLISRSIRQSMELFRYIRQAHAACGEPVKAIRETMTELELSNSSRIVCLPGKEETIRGYQGVALIIYDEAARIPDDLHASVTPMLAISQGQEISLTTPWGQRGWFWKKWMQSQVHVKRFKITWQQCPRHTAEFIQQERLTHGDSWVQQEYECSFESLSGLVYPDFAEQTGVDISPLTQRVQAVGGIDFGFRNPFAALWGWLKFDDVLHIDDERYLREVTLPVHADALPKNVVFYADPAGAQEIASLRRAGLSIKRGNNHIRAGIAAVHARLETGRLRITRHRCPNIFAEAQMYRWNDANTKEEPIDDNNHALVALRYLIATIDRRFVNHYLRNNPTATQTDRGPDIDETAEGVFGIRPQPRTAPALDFSDPSLWTPLN